MKTFLKLIGVMAIIIITGLIASTPIVLLENYLESRFSDTTMIIVYGSILLLFVGLISYSIVRNHKD